MNIRTLNSLLLFCTIGLSLTSCAKSGDDFWDNTRTAGRHMSRGIRSLGGKHRDSRQIQSREEFLCYRNDQYCIEDFQDMPFEPLPDQPYSQEINFEMQKPADEPGMPSSRIPGIEAFNDPSRVQGMKEVFATIYYPYNSSLVKGKENMEIVHNIAQYMKRYPNTYIFIEGHCDERGAEAYNLALGSRRSNAVRNLLIKDGVSPENIFTVSYGKERPLDLGHNEEAWMKNRRAQFKVYQH